MIYQTKDICSVANEARQKLKDRDYESAFITAKAALGMIREFESELKDLVHECEQAKNPALRVRDDVPHRGRLDWKTGKPLSEVGK